MKNHKSQLHCSARDSVIRIHCVGTAEWMAIQKQPTNQQIHTEYTCCYTNNDPNNIKDQKSNYMRHEFQNDFGDWILEVERQQ